MLTANANTTPAEMMAQVITMAKAFGCCANVVDKLEECENIVRGYDADLEKAFARGAKKARADAIATIEGADVPEFTKEDDE